MKCSSRRRICLNPGQNGRCSKIIANSECPDIWIRPPRHTWPKSWSRMEDPVVPLERNLYGHPDYVKRQFEKIQLQYCWEKVPNCECLFVHPEKGIFFFVCVETKYQSDVKSTKQRS